MLDVWLALSDRKKGTRFIRRDACGSNLPLQHRDRALEREIQHGQ